MAGSSKVKIDGRAVSKILKSEAVGNKLLEVARKYEAYDPSKPIQSTADKFRQPRLKKLKWVQVAYKPRLTNKKYRSEWTKWLQYYGETPRERALAAIMRKRGAE